MTTLPTAAQVRAAMHITGTSYVSCRSAITETAGKIAADTLLSEMPRYLRTQFRGLGALIREKPLWEATQGRNDFLEACAAWLETLERGASVEETSATPAAPSWEDIW